MVTWIITNRHRRLSEPLRQYPVQAARAHLTYEREVFVFGINDGRVIEVMYYWR